MSAQQSSFVQVPAVESQSKIVAGYTLQQKLGSGSFAVVYKGVKQDAPPVAIKAIQRNSDKLTPKVLQNLEIEIAILRTYRHPNIVCLHDVQKTERHFYLMLEYCGGGDVQGLIRSRQKGRLSETLTRRLMRDLAAGLKFLWRQELIHRDIKPQNLLLTGVLPLDEMDDPEKTPELEEQRRQANFPSTQFQLKIADFGFARHLQSASLAETLCGSPLYMAPEILQHHRYDAKADLWSVGTVLFEMISGRPPFNGENHLDLLRNIQRKAVRLPTDVRVSKECVNLLRLLLNRNPLSRAGFKEFSEACAAFVALGCSGRPTPEPETPSTRQELNAQSMMTVATRAPSAPQAQVQPVPIPVSTILSKSPKQPHGMRPLVPSPPTLDHNPLAVWESHLQQMTQGPPAPDLSNRGSSEPNSGENSFVMVEHTGTSISSQRSTEVVSRAQDPKARFDLTPPSSPGYFLGRNNPLRSSRGDYMVMKYPKGMLSTSPGTGGALMGLLSGRARIAPQSDVGQGKHIEGQLKETLKMLAAAEDVGRRAVTVAHLGDNRAFVAMHLVMMGDSTSSLQRSVTPMDGIVEEAEDQDSGEVTDDSSSTEIMASVRRRRSSSATDKSMPDAKACDDPEEMPFAMPSESQPLVSAGMPTRASNSFSRGGASITSSKSIGPKPTPYEIRRHFGEALSCYLKALHMLKGTVAGAKRVEKEIDSLAAMRLSAEQQAIVENALKRSTTTSRWLGEQFKGVLERADAANVEIAKLPGGERNEVDNIKSVEELIYHHSIVHSREGAAKHLLGQFDAARSSYRSAGLLAETLLMESHLGSDDRKLLEGYVDGFAARIRELDTAILQQSRMAASSATVSSARNGPAIVSVIGNP